MQRAYYEWLVPALQSKMVRFVALGTTRFSEPRGPGSSALAALGTLTAQGIWLTKSRSSRCSASNLYLDPGNLKSRNFIGANAEYFFRGSRCHRRWDLLGSIRITNERWRGTAAVVVGAGLVVDARTLLSVVAVGGALEES